jgi:hypothetical protein
VVKRRRIKRTEEQQRWIEALLALNAVGETLFPRDWELKQRLALVVQHSGATREEMVTAVQNVEDMKTIRRRDGGTLHCRMELELVPPPE